MCRNLAGGERHSPCGRVSTSWAKGHSEGLDYHVNVPEYVPDRIGIKRVARHLIEACILDWYDCGRTRQGPNAVANQEYRSCRWEEVVRIPEEGGVRDYQSGQTCVWSPRSSSKSAAWIILKASTPCSKCLPSAGL